MRITPDFVITIAERGIVVVLMISGPLMLIALGIGLAVSIFQATTQIQEQTLAFAPKIVAVLVGLLFFGPWMITQVLTFTREIFSYLTGFTG